MRLKKYSTPHDNNEFLSLSRGTGNGVEVPFFHDWGGSLRLQHQGKNPHFTEKVTYSVRLKEMLWTLLGYFLQNARMSAFWWEQPHLEGTDPSEQSSVPGSGNGCYQAC